MNLKLDGMFDRMLEHIVPLLGKAMGWTVLVLTPIHATLMAVSMLVVVDLITGVWASMKRNEKITSNGIRRTISKTVAYMMAIICSFIMEQQFLKGIPVVQVVSGLIAITEFKSLLENLTSITGLDFWELIVNKVQGKKIQPTPKELKPKKPKRDFSK